MPGSIIDFLARGRWFVLVAVLAGPANVVAQTEADSSTPPSGPLLKAAPSLSQWTITFTYPEEQKANDAGSPPGAGKMPENVAARPKTIVTTKTGEIIHEETTTVGGTKTEDWQVHGNYYIKVPGNNFWSAYEKTDTSVETIHTRLAAVLPASGFTGLDWVDQDTFAGKIRTSVGYNLVFVPGGMSTLNAGNPSGQAKLQSLPTLAYIDAETRLPVTVRAAGVTRQFAFSTSPPDSTQALPADLADEIKKGDAIRAKRDAAPQREY